VLTGNQHCWHAIHASCYLQLQIKLSRPAAAALFVSETELQGLKETVSTLKTEVLQLKAAAAARDAKERKAIAIVSTAAKQRVRAVIATQPGYRVTHPTNAATTSKVNVVSMLLVA
jgi:hypothetical protein